MSESRKKMTKVLSRSKRRKINTFNKLIRASYKIFSQKKRKETEREGKGRLQEVTHFRIAVGTRPMVPNCSGRIRVS
jgi:hypothetical protein